MTITVTINGTARTIDVDTRHGKAKLVFVAANAMVAIASYLFLVGRIERVELDDR